MELVELSSLSFAAIIPIFLAAGIMVWIAGTKLSVLADRFSEQTGVGRSFMGFLLLGGITSLPEAATTVTASIQGNAGMAISNIMGGISMQVTILGVVDFWQQKKPLSSTSNDIVVIMQGILLMFMLALAAGLTVSETPAIFHIGIDSLGIFIMFLLSIYFVHKYSPFAWLSYSRIKADNLQLNIDQLTRRLEELSQQPEPGKEKENISVGTYLSRKGWTLLLWSLLILVAGYFVILSGETIAARTGLSGNFVGLVLVAITTSLPEVSTTIKAIRLGKYDMALSNIFGTNLFDVAMIFIADLLFLKGPVLREAGRFGVVAGLLGIILTGIYMLGILAKSKKQLLGIGIDSWCIIISYLAGISLLYFMSS